MLASPSLSRKITAILDLASTESSSSSSAETVEGNCDLLAVILVKLPAKSIFRFRCVSDRWNSIISSPCFLESYYRAQKERMRLVGCIQHSYSGNVPFSKILPIRPTNDHKLDTSIKLKYQFLFSCDGLLLLKRINDPITFEYHILNPLTNRSIIVSQPPHKIREISVVALVCDDQQENMRQLVLNYKVVAAGKIKNRKSATMIQTFSSKTRRWTTSTLTATGKFEFKSDGSIVVNGIIYWYTDCGGLAVYDTTSVTDDDYDDETTRKQQQLQLIELPCCWLGFVSHRIDRSSSLPDDALWYSVDIRPLTEINMWMLPDDEYDRYKKCATTIPKSEWILMHNISYQQLCKTILPPVVGPSKIRKVIQSVVDTKYWRV